MVEMEVMAVAVAGMLPGGGKYAGEAKRIPKKHVHCSRWWSTSMIKFSFGQRSHQRAKKKACLSAILRSFYIFQFSSVLHRCETALSNE